MTSAKKSFSGIGQSEVSAKMAKAIVSGGLIFGGDQYALVSGRKNNGKDNK